MLNYFEIRIVMLLNNHRNWNKFKIGTKKNLFPASCSLLGYCPTGPTPSSPLIIQRSLFSLQKIFSISSQVSCLRIFTIYFLFGVLTSQFLTHLLVLFIIYMFLNCILYLCLMKEESISSVMHRTWWTTWDLGGSFDMIIIGIFSLIFCSQDFRFICNFKLILQFPTALL